MADCEIRKYIIKDKIEPGRIETDEMGIVEDAYVRSGGSWNFLLAMDIRQLCLFIGAYLDLLQIIFTTLRISIWLQTTIDVSTNHFGNQFQVVLLLEFIACQQNSHDNAIALRVIRNDILVVESTELVNSRDRYLANSCTSVIQMDPSHEQNEFLFVAHQMDTE